VNLRAVGNSTLIVVAVTYGVLLQIALQAGLFGITLGWMVALSLGRYGYAVLRDVARGRPNLQAPGLETMNPWSDGSVALHITLFGLLAYLCATTPLLGDGVLGATVHYVGLALVVAVYPASAALMGITSNLAAAFDPQAVATVIGVLRRRYLVLLALGALLWLATAAAQSAVASAAGFLAPVLGRVLAAWTYLALLALIGVAVHEQRADFDLSADADVRADRERQDRERVWKGALDRAYGSIRSGFVERGYAAVKGLIASERESLEVYQWVFNAMLDWEEPRHALELGRRFVVRLVEEQRPQTALELIEQCRQLSPTFALPPEVAVLGDYARSAGRPRLADELAAAPVARPEA
jgi:hypothetical protein